MDRHYIYVNEDILFVMVYEKKFQFTVLSCVGYAHDRLRGMFIKDFEQLRISPSVRFVIYAHGLKESTFFRWFEIYYLPLTC